MGVQSDMLAKPSLTSYIRFCTSTTNCGNFILGYPGFTIQNTFTHFDLRKNYTLFMNCYNRIKAAVTPSDIYQLYTFEAVCPNTTVEYNNTCITNSTYEAIKAANDTFLALNSSKITSMYFVLSYAIMIFTVVIILV